MDDLISRQAAIDLIEHDKIGSGSPFVSLPRAQVVNRTCDRHVEGIKNLPSAQPDVPDTNVGDLISRQAAIDALRNRWNRTRNYEGIGADIAEECEIYLKMVPSAEQDCKYEYHYDHTDCIWYRPEARNRCPCTCAQYRDGWNDAMNYIFRDGKGYRPYRRDEQYGE